VALDVDWFPELIVDRLEMSVEVHVDALVD
jgi:hypothetical protein